jgi:Asp-tRNA(Asn)/Glu-tRNA(Gln) amidotransferase A subunit family amidase
MSDTVRDTNRLSAAAAVAQLAAGTLTAEALTRACLDRAADRASVKAWTWLDPEQALAQARAADRAGRPGLLAGLPIGVKDIIDTADMPTEHGSPIYRGNRPFADAACVALVRMAGGTILGKTVTTEFANRFPGETVNPHNPAHTPGGSSSGSAAAVADFQVPAALGTQTGGSVIRPSAFCGVVGYKPSFGEFSRAGIKLQCHNLDTLGVICRAVADIPPLRAAILGQPLRRIDPGVSAPRIGLCRTPGWERADAATQSLIERTASALSAAGARLSDIDFAPEFANILEHHRRIFNFEAARNYAYEYERHHERVSQVLRDTVLTPGRELPLAAYVEAIETAETFRRHLDDIFGDVDLLLTPSAAGEAPEGLGSTGDPSFNSIWTLAWTPCVTVPAGTGPRGLPLGAQLVGQRFRDEAILDAAAWVAGRLERESG